MKLRTAEEEAGHEAATTRGGLRGIAVSSAISLPAAYLANKRYPYYRSLTPALKAFSIIMVVVPSMMISAENEGARYERSLWHDAGKREMDDFERQRLERLNAMSSTDRWKTWAKENQYSLISAGWLASMVGSFTYVARDKTQTTTQKIIQARVIAQAATLALLLGAGYMTYPSKQAEKVDKVDHSWKTTLLANQAEQEEFDKNAAIAARMSHKPPATGGAAPSSSK